MRFKMYTILISFVLSLFSCWEINNPPDDKRILWESEIIGGDKTASNRIFPLIFNDNIVISRSNFDRSQSALICFDKKTGAKKWEWTDSYFNSEGTEINIELHTQAFVYNNIIIGLDYNKMYGINAESGKTIWKTVFDDHISDRFFLFEGKIYCMSRDYYIHNKLIFYILDPNDGNYNLLFEVSGYEEGYNIASGSFCIFKNKDEENCLLFGILHIKDPYTANQDVKYGMMYYNIGKKSILYNQSYSNIVGLSNLYIHENKIYSTGSYFSKYEFATGKLIEQFKQDQSTIDYTTLYDYPYVYLMYNNTTNRLVKVNMETMKEVGRLSLNGHQAYTILKIDGNLYVHARDGQIYVIDKNNFQIIEQITAPHYDENSYYSFDENFSIDDETGYFYCTDFKHLICYDLDK